MSKKRIFAEEHPEYLKYWDFDKNTLDPYKLDRCATKKPTGNANTVTVLYVLLMGLLEELRNVQYVRTERQM